MAETSAPIGRTGNIILIGMPGVGKTTIGRRLADCLKFPFLDTDDVIEKQNGMPLQRLLEVRGRDGFYHAEENAVLSLDCRGHVIATGGSVVYSLKAMDHLRNIGFVIYLGIDLTELKRRLSNYQSRGILKSPGQSLEALFREREPLYRERAHLKIDCFRKSQEAVVKTIVSALKLSMPVRG